MNPISALRNAIRERFSITLERGDDEDAIPSFARSSRNVSTYWHHYKTNPLVRSAVVEVVHALIGIPLMAEYYDGRTWLPLPPTDRLSMLLRRPSRSTPAAVFWGKLYTDHVVAGNHYIFKRAFANGSGIAEFVRLDAKHTRPEAGTDTEVAEYLYDPQRIIGDGTSLIGAPSSSAIRYPANKVIHVPGDPDPDYPLLGLSPIAAALRDVDLDNAITDFTQSVMDNGSVLDKAFITRQKVSEAEARRFERRWRRRRAGPKNAGGLVVIDGTEGTLQNLGMSLGARDMGLTDLRKQVEARVLMAMDVPPIVVGSIVGLENATYSNYMQARLAFHEENTDPNLWRFTSALEHGLADEFPEHAGKQIRIRPDLSRVMALLDWEDRRRRLALAEWNGGIKTQTEARASIDLPPLPGGDFYAFPLNTSRRGPDGDADEADSATAPVPDADTAVQSLALNGAQIASLLEIVQQVTDNRLAPETAKGLIKAAFPSLTDEAIAQIVDSAATFEPASVPAPPPATPPAPAPIEDDTEPATVAAHIRRASQSVALRELALYAIRLGVPADTLTPGLIAGTAYAANEAGPGTRTERAERMADHVYAASLRHVAEAAGE